MISRNCTACHANLNVTKCFWSFKRVAIGAVVVAYATVLRLGGTFGFGYLIDDPLDQDYADVDVAGYVGDKLGDEVVDGRGSQVYGRAAGNGDGFEGLVMAGVRSSIDHCGTIGSSAIDSAHRAAETEEENVWQSLPARGEPS